MHCSPYQCLPGGAEESASLFLWLEAFFLLCHLGNHLLVKWSKKTICCQLSWWVLGIFPVPKESRWWIAFQFLTHCCLLLSCYCVSFWSFLFQVIFSLFEFAALKDFAVNVLTLPWYLEHCFWQVLFFLAAFDLWECVHKLLDIWGRQTVTKTCLDPKSSIPLCRSFSLPFYLHIIFFISYKHFIFFCFPLVFLQVIDIFLKTRWQASCRIQATLVSAKYNLIITPDKLLPSVISAFASRSNCWLVFHCVSWEGT